MVLGVQVGLLGLSRMAPLNADRGRKLASIGFTVDLYERGEPVIVVSRPATSRRIPPPLALMRSLHDYAVRCMGRRAKQRSADGAEAAGFGQLAGELRRLDAAEQQVEEETCTAEATGFIVDCGGCSRHRRKDS